MWRVVFRPWKTSRFCMNVFGWSMEGWYAIDPFAPNTEEMVVTFVLWYPHNPRRQVARVASKMVRHGRHKSLAT